MNQIFQRLFPVNVTPGWHVQVLKVEQLEQRHVGADGIIKALAGAGNPGQVLWIDISQDMVDDFRWEVCKEDHGGVCASLFPQCDG
jgi:hypothetical protein